MATSPSTAITVPASGLTPISAANSASAASNAYAAGDRIGNATMAANNLVLPGVSIRPVSDGTVAMVLRLVKRAYATGGSALLTGVVTSMNCSGGGNFTRDWVVRDAATLSNGDTLTLTASNCIEPGAPKLNGVLRIAVSGVTGDLVRTNSGTVTLATSFEGLTYDDTATGGSHLMLLGDMKIAVNSSVAGDSFTVSGGSLNETYSWPSGAKVTRTVTRYTGTTTANSTGVTMSSNFEVSGYGGVLGFYVYHVENRQPIFFPVTHANAPASGSLVVKGDASSIALTVLDANRVKLDYSAKGDGVVTQTRTLDWNSFVDTQ